MSLFPLWLRREVLPAARPGGRPRTTDLRSILNAIFYLLRTGCQWRMLPREFPLWGTVDHYFQGWQSSVVWVHLHRVLYEQARRVAGRATCPSVVIMDGQSVKTTGAWWCSWFRRTQAGQGTHTPHPGRH